MVLAINLTWINWNQTGVKQPRISVTLHGFWVQRLWVNAYRDKYHGKKGKTSG